MTHDESNLRTKKLLADALKSKMEKKPLSKITVSELIKDCNINRKTFYYHFQDIYDLLKWIFEEEAVEVVRNFNLLIDFEDCISFVLDYVMSNAHILNCAYDSLGREEMRRFLREDFKSISSDMLIQMEKEMNLSVNDDYLDFLSAAISEVLASMLIDWFKDRSTRSKETTINYLTLMFRSTLPEMLRQGPSAKIK